MARLSDMINSGINPGNALVETNVFTVTDDEQVTFILSSPVVDKKYLLVFLNGVEFPTTNFTCCEEQLILNEPLDVNDVLKVVHFKNFNAAENKNEPLIETFSGGNSEYTLSVAPRNANGIIVAVDGLVKTPGLHYTLTANNTKLSFLSAPNESCEIVVIHLFGAIITTSTVLPNSVTLNELALDSIDTRYAKHETVYNKVEVDEKINFILNNAPELIASLSEISESLNNDPNFATNIQEQINTKADKNHNHDSMYYTKSLIDNLLSKKAGANVYYNKGQVNTLLGQKANLDEVYTRAEIDCMIQGNSNCINNSHVTSGNRGLFVGGQNQLNNENSIEYITISTFGNSIEFGNLMHNVRYSGATSNGVNNIGLVGGGFTTSNIATIQKINILSADTANMFGNLVAPRSELGSTSNGTKNRSLFVGGNGGFNFDIEYVTTNTPSNSTIFGNILGGRKSGIAATSNGINDRGVFGSIMGSNNTFQSEFVSIPVLSNSVIFGNLYNGMYVSAASNDTHDRGVFAGGRPDCCSFLGTIQFINIAVQSNADSFGTLTLPRAELAATSNGVNQRAVFGGGINGETFHDEMDYITISVLSNAAPFGKLMSHKKGLSALSNSQL